MLRVGGGLGCLPLARRLTKVPDVLRKLKPEAKVVEGIQRGRRRGAGKLRRNRSGPRDKVGGGALIRRSARQLRQDRCACLVCARVGGCGLCSSQQDLRLMRFGRLERVAQAQHLGRRHFCDGDWLRLGPRGRDRRSAQHNGCHGCIHSHAFSPSSPSERMFKPCSSSLAYRFGLPMPSCRAASERLPPARESARSSMYFSS